MSAFVGKADTGQNRCASMSGYDPKRNEEAGAHRLSCWAKTGRGSFYRAADALN